MAYSLEEYYSTIKQWSNKLFGRDLTTTELGIVGREWSQYVAGNSDLQNVGQLMAYLVRNEDTLTSTLNITKGGYETHNPGSDIWEYEPTELDDKKAQQAGQNPGVDADNFGEGQHPGDADGYVPGGTGSGSGSGSTSSPSTPVVDEPNPNAHTTSPEEVKAVFKFLGMNEPDKDRLNEIVGDINSGERTITDVRNDLMQYQADQAGAGTSIRDIAAGYVRNVFEEEGASLATSEETEEVRLDRLVDEVLEGYSGFNGDNMSAGRSFADIRNSLQDYKKDHPAVVQPVEDDTKLVVAPPAEEDEEQPVGFGGTGGDTDVVEPVVVQPENKSSSTTSTEDDVRGVFNFLGLSANDERVGKIAGQIDSGERNLIDVRNDLMQWQADQDPNISVRDVAAGHIREIFKEEGASLATSKESEEKRLDRLVNEVLEGHKGSDRDTGRTFADIRKGIRGEGSTWKSGITEGINPPKLDVAKKPNTKVVNKTKPETKKPYGAGGEDLETQDGHKPATGKYSETEKLEEERKKKEQLQATSNEIKEKAEKKLTLALSNPTVGKVRKVFEGLGLTVTDGRAIKIAGEIDKGDRTYGSVRQDLMKWQKNDAAKKAAAVVSPGSSSGVGNESMIVAAPKPAGGGGGRVNLF